MFNLWASSKMMKIIGNTLVDLPSPSSISTLWNFGSLLGVCLITQILSGMFLAMHYSCHVDLAFNSVDHIMRDVNFGWALRMMHANGASLFFICLYSHAARGIYYGSFFYIQTWMVGVTLLFLVMGTAFLGYVLPWGQMSFWGATVITNLASAIPYVGNQIVFWLWGGFAVDNATLTRFFMFHFLLPFILMGLSAIHLFFLHETGSTNPLGLESNFDKISFHPYFTIKDFLGVLMFFLLFFLVCSFYPWDLGDPENFIPANSLVTPIHIQPEWYFLFAYAILRSIPNKLGGVMALVASIAILYTLPFLNLKPLKSNSFYPLEKINFYILLNTIVLLTWIGARPVEEPYILVGQSLTFIYFSLFIISPLLQKFQLKVFFSDPHF